MRLKGFHGIKRGPVLVTVIPSVPLTGRSLPLTSGPSFPLTVAFFETKQKGGFVKGWFWQMCPRSGFLWAVVPVLVPSLLPPKKNEIDTKNCLKIMKKGPKNDPKRVRKVLSPPSRRLTISHRRFSKSSSPLKFCTSKKVVFSPRGLAGAATLSIRQDHPFGNHGPFYEPPILNCPIVSRSPQVLVA